MDPGEDRNENAGDPPTTSQIRNEETGETEQGAYFQYRIIGELFVSDDESDESFANVSSDESSHDAETLNTDKAMNNPSISGYLDSVPSFYEKVPCLFDNDREIPQQENKAILKQISHQENEDLITKLNEIILNDESRICQISEKVEISHDIENVSDHRSSQENTTSAAHKSRSYYPESSDYSPQNLESSAKRGAICSMSPQDSMPQHSNFSNPFTESSNRMPYKSLDIGTYSMITSPISSRYINSENTQSSQALRNSNISRRTETHIPESNLSSTSFHRLPNSPSTSFEFPTDIIRKNLSRFWEHGDTSSNNINSTQESSTSNISLSPNSSVRNTTDERDSLNSDLLNERLYRSCEKPSTSTSDIFTTKDHDYVNACTSSSSRIGKKNASSLSDLPSTSKISPQRTALSFFSFPTHAPRSARKLNFDSDTSSDDSKEKYPTLTGTSVRKLGKKNEPRKKRKTSHLLKSSENHSTSFPKIGNDKNTSENIHFSPLSEIPDKKSSKPDESDSVSSVSGSLEIKNSETFETNQSSRKRLISDTKASDSDEANVKSKKNKKLKQRDQVMKK